jgi:hypothetical protein
MSFSEICARYKKILCHSKRYVWSVPNTKHGAIQKDLVADNEWSPYKSFCSMGTIMKFVINMEGLDADLEQI